MHKSPLGAPGFEDMKGHGEQLRLSTERPGEVIVKVHPRFKTLSYKDLIYIVEFWFCFDHNYVLVLSS